MRFAFYPTVLVITLVLGIAHQHAEAVEPRRVNGRVLTSDGEAVQGAVVQIKNTLTLQIRSFITQEDGRYHFGGLNPDVDYEVGARLRDRASSTKMVSKFDSKQIVELDLVLGREER
jgi:hypothetical protein